MEEWPEELPQSPLIQSIEVDMYENKYVFSPKAGKDKIVRFTTTQPEIYSLTYYMTTEQKEIFEQFYKNIYYGRDRFLLPSIYDKNEYWFVRMLEEPEYDHRGSDIWFVSLEFERQ